MMHKYLLSMLLVRVVLPAGLLLSIALRPFGLSLVYLLLFLLAPLAQIPDSRTFKGWRGTYLCLVASVSFLLMLFHAAWHTVLASFSPYGSLLEDFPIIETIGLNLGLVSFYNIDSLMAVHYMAPELVMMCTSLVVYLFVKKLMTGPDAPEICESKYQRFPNLTSAGKYISLFLIMFSGILRPSVTSGIYFLVFMGAATAWAVGRPLQRGFAVVGRCVMAIMAVHIAVLLAYQSTWFCEFYPPENDMARYFGLTKLVAINETLSNSFKFEVTDNHMWATLASPLVILFTYFVLAIQTRELFKSKAKKKSALTGLEAGKANGSLSRVTSFHRVNRRALTRDKWRSATNKVQVAFPYLSSKADRGNPSETTPLMRHHSISRKWSSHRPTAMQDSTGSVTLRDDDNSLDDDEPTLMDDIIAAVLDFFQVLIRSSYIATTITMMAWSIMYHSWLTFVLLMWANVVWLCQDQRSFMLKTSPVLVCYAMLLLLAQYIYGMNLYEAELPSNITEVNLLQIGLGRSEGEPCVNLLMKSLFTCMFWVTLRQRVQELRQRRRSAVITDMAAPLQLTVSAAASVMDTQREEETKSRLLRVLGEWLRSMCARYWIYVVVIMLFVIGITGERMTIFRIIYMFLFLAFILMFQISWYWWRRLMYIFWIVVIIYSMLNLILIYIYQFDNFSKLIETYLRINERLQHDLGLDRYHPADLFVKLLTPTLFLIITIMQVHYFHKDFMALSNQRTKTNSANRPGSSKPSNAGASTNNDAPTLPNETPSRPDSETQAGSLDSTIGSPVRTVPSINLISEEKPHSFKSLLLTGYRHSREFLMEWTDKIFIYLDINLVKIIFLALMLLCAMNPCALHVPIMILISPALWMSVRRQRVCVLLISTLISVYLMAKMVYQIDYIQHSFFDVNCTSIITVNNTSVDTEKTYNNAAWFGFTKASTALPLAVLLKGYIALIAVFTFYSLVTYRQQALREEGLLPLDKDKKMFPEILREHADLDLVHCFKYLVNFGFYKFGVEVTLICLMGVIGSRMDVYAVFYAGWLLLLVSIHRPKQAKMWPAFTAFIAFIIPLQYMIAVGFIPQLCVRYPWSGDYERMKHIRTWLFLPFADDPPHAAKIIFDYILLLFATRQLRVFKIERLRGDSYPGGSNEENVGTDWETPNFVNPVPDFLGYVGSWLDVVKRMVFLGLLWVTLAIMFMTGTNRVNLFSMGYLIGSFIFLWQGTDFYLRPKEAILRWWSWLVRYNVGVVVVKTILQIPGCIFSEVMQDNACWLVQLLGIGCVDKFVGGNLARFLKMHVAAQEQACSVPQEDIGLAWDGVCFAFLILQRRLFHSYYFYRVIDESKATTVLASRGAELIEELRQKQMNVQEDTETKILEKIKLKMERIKANQKKVQGAIAKDPRHHDAEEEEETQPEESEQVPLVRGDSDVSGRGYHTPDSPTSPRGFHTPISEPSAPPSPEHRPPTTIEIPFPVIPAPSSHGGPPSPSSALMTVSLDAYLEPRRISFGSPPSSELLPRAQSPEESYPVFSPPPIRRRHTVASPSFQQRTSIISQSSRAEPHSHHTSVRSGDYYMFDEFDDTEHMGVVDDESSEDEDDPKEMGFGRLLSTVIKTDLKRAVSMRRGSAPTERSIQRFTDRSLPQSYPTEGRRAQSSSEERPAGILRETEDVVESEMDDFGEPAQDKWYRKAKDILTAAWAFISSILISLTRYLMKFSRDYRYVSKTLSAEKKKLKEKPGFGIGIREGSQMIWEPLPETLVIQHRKLSDISVPEIRLIAPSMERGLDASPPSHRASPSQHVGQQIGQRVDQQADQSGRESDYDDDTSEHESAFSLQNTSSKDVTVLEEQDDSMFKQEKSPIMHLIYALWFAVLAHTDIVCYIMVFINQIQSATILSIPLPLMVFLWGTLTIPRPTKTFWVTLIAYTEVIVLIKSMFQFEILPWNQKSIPANMPFTAPRIIGIERKFNYALYDLLLLLIIFLHRFMLKSLGLWKESTPEIELREDVEYDLTPEDTQKFIEGNGEEVGQKYVVLHDQTGPRHRLVDRLYHVVATITNAMEELGATRSDPRVATLVWQKLQRVKSRHRQKDADITESRRLVNYGDGGDEDGAGPSRLDDEELEVEREDAVISVTTTLEKTYGHYPDVMLLAIKRYLRPMHSFFTRMLAPGARVTADVYAYMFLCDFFNFMVVIFGFAAFGTHQGDGGVKAYLEENKVPIPFLIMLILQFGLIIIDRALYLRKYMLGKILFQYGLIIGVHIWMFFVLPFITERTFNALVPPPMWYMIKCIYLLLSAYQIRCGYPRRIIGNFLCKSYRFLNMICFRGFMAVPFVFELRTLMDWIWTDTSMTLLDWLKMEDIFASVFLLKCSRYVEDEFPQPRGQKKSSTAKYLLGGGVLAFVIAIIWFPLVFFAFGNSVGIPNPPTDVTVKIRIGPFLPVFQMSAQSHNIHVFTEQDFTQLSNLYARDRTAQTFLSNYMYNDVAVVTINPNSTLEWIISPPELQRLRKEAMSNSSLQIKFSYVITHPTNAVPNPPTIDENREVELEAFVVENNEAKSNPARDILSALLNGTAQPDTWVDVKTLFPKFVKVFNKGSTKAAFQLMPQTGPDEPEDTRLYRDVQMRLERVNNSMYWRVRENCARLDPLTSIPFNDCDMLVMYTFNDKLFPETLNIISGSGIIGLYTTFVFLASRVLRGFFSGIYTKIMFDDLPNVDRVLQLCLDIYLVREALELTLEEDLFAKLVFLYRSPETMIKWSRPKEEPEPRALPPTH